MQQNQYTTLPVNKRPILPSSGIPNSGPGGYGWTPHVFVRTDARPDRNYGELRMEYVHVFACTVTGAEREFGLQGMATPELFEGDLDGAE